MKRLLYSLSSTIALSIDSPRIPSSGTQPTIQIKGPTEIPIGGLTRSGPEGTTTAQEIIRNGIIILIISAILLSLAFLIIGGIQWTMSGGEKSKIDAARRKIIYAIVGLIVVFLSFFIISIFGYLFGVDIF